MKYISYIVRMKTNIPVTTEQRRFIDWALCDNTHDLEIVDNHGTTIWHATMQGLLTSSLANGTYKEGHAYLYNDLATKLKSEYEEHLLR